MSRVIPKPPFVGIDTRSFRPLGPILHGAGTNQHWAPVVEAANLALLDVHAGPVILDGWSDGQFDQADGSPPTVQVRYQIPPAPTPRHTTCAFRVWARGDEGLVTVSATNSGAIVPIAIDSPTFDWFEADVAITAQGQSEIVTISGSGEIEVLSVQAEWVPPLAAGADDWPQDVGAHAPGLLDDDVVPLDSDDFAQDAPYGADVLDDVVAANEHAQGRLRPLVSLSAPANPAGGFDGFVARRPHRRLLPVPFRGQTLTVRYYAAGGLTNSNIWIQVGPGRPRAIMARRAGRSIQRFVVAAGAPAAWREETFYLPDVVEAGFPLRYPGFTHLAVFPDGEVELGSICIWGAE